MKRIFSFCLIVLMLVSVNSVLASDTNNQQTVPYPAGIPSKITPFNFTTTLRWTPYMISNPTQISDLATAGALGPVKGEKLPVYSTLLPMMPNITILEYSLKVLYLRGPSNISIGFNVELASTTFGTSIFNLDNKTALNTTLESKVSGSIPINVSKVFISFPNSSEKVNPYSYANIMRNISQYWAYSMITIQPYSNNKSIAWNHFLVLQVSIKGMEDREFFNYMKTQKGFSPWTDTDFQPVSIPSSIYTDNTTQMYFLGPSSQPSLSNSSTILLAYLGNQTDHYNKVLQVLMTTTSNKDFKIYFSVSTLSLSITNSQSYYYADSFITTVSPDYNQLAVEIPWNKLQGLNNSFNSLVGSSNSVIILNKIEIHFLSINSPWSQWLKTQIKVNWKAGLNLPYNSMKVQLDNKIYLINFTKTNTNFQVFDFTSLTTTQSGSKSPLPGFEFQITSIFILFAVLLRKRKKIVGK